jgi:hypothetical protein
MRRDEWYSRSEPGRQRLLKSFALDRLEDVGCLISYVRQIHITCHRAARIQS